MSFSNINLGEPNEPVNNGGAQGNPANELDITNMGGNDDSTSLNDDNNQKPDPNNNDDNQPDNQPDDNNNGNPSTGELEVGTNIEFDGKTYTVSETGDIVDDKGEVFKKASEVKDWLAQQQVDDGNDELSLEAIQNALGTEILDDKGNKVEFTNDVDGVKSYVNSVIELRSNEIQQAAINKLYQANPLLKQFQDYVAVTGTPRGFGELPDRRNIQLSQDNETQLIAVIKQAAAEFGNKSLNDNYIAYLKSNGGLYDEAKAQLEALVNKDIKTREYYAQQAQAQEQQELEEYNKYWNNVNEVIKNRTVAGYKLPESIIKEVNGQKITLTPNDFYEYLHNATENDEEGNRFTKYQRDLRNMSDEDLLANELLQAWLMFTGGSYKDLVNMAIKEDKVRTLRIKAKNNRTSSTVKINKPQSKGNINDVILS